MYVYKRRKKNVTKFKKIKKKQKTKNETCTQKRDPKKKKKINMSAKKV